ncbi:MAG TPA: RNA polymerase sigma-70 factor [Ktedonobacterales bacterium]|jgi:RNA polymerase sigma-70 factor (ECF subfamily)|nr:RNA polymerase sigma-70 factor [Ktedonobacterales bacterium]
MNQTLNQFEASRGKLFSIAYHMLGSVSDAEDTVQEAYLRYHNAAREEIRSPEAFLSTVVTRLCLNQLQSARAQRETYLGPWLPEPLMTEDDTLVAQAQTRESISMAFLVLLERLTPPERAVFLLHEVFDYSFAEVAEIIGKEEATCRQIFRRAKQFIVAQRPRFTPSSEQHTQMLQRFMDAVGDGNLDALTRLLADDVTLWTDGGGKAKGAATRPVHGASSVARFIVGSMRNYPAPVEVEITHANGEPAIIFRAAGVPVVFIGMTIADQAIQALRVIGNPDKLRSLPR